MGEIIVLFFGFILFIATTFVPNLTVGIMLANGAGKSAPAAAGKMRLLFLLPIEGLIIVGLTVAAINEYVPLAKLNRAFHIKTLLPEAKRIDPRPVSTIDIHISSSDALRSLDENLLVFAGREIILIDFSSGSRKKTVSLPEDYYFSSSDGDIGPFKYNKNVYYVLKRRGGPGLGSDRTFSIDSNGNTKEISLQDYSSVKAKAGQDISQPYQYVSQDGQRRVDYRDLITFTDGAGKVIKQYRFRGYLVAAAGNTVLIRPNPLKPNFFNALLNDDFRSFNDQFLAPTRSHYVLGRTYIFDLRDGRALASVHFHRPLRVSETSPFGLYDTNYFTTTKNFYIVNVVDPGKSRILLIP